MSRCDSDRSVYPNKKRTQNLGIQEQNHESKAFSRTHRNVKHRREEKRDEGSRSFKKEQHVCVSLIEDWASGRASGHRSSTISPPSLGHPSSPSLISLPLRPETRLPVRGRKSEKDWEGKNRDREQASAKAMFTCSSKGHHRANNRHCPVPMGTKRFSQSIRKKNTVCDTNMARVRAGKNNTICLCCSH